MAGTQGDPAVKPRAGDPNAHPDYVRKPTPHAALLDAQGAEVDVISLARASAMLLVFAPSDDARLTEQLDQRVRAWASQLPLVRVQLVIRAGQELDSGAPAEQRVLFDPEGRCLRSFGTSTTPMAVLLGTDGLLAGGPATGIDAVHDLVHQVIDQLTGHWTHGDTLVLHAPSLPSRPRSVGIVVSTFGAPGFVALQLESARRFAPGTPVLIHDDCSGDPALVMLAERYDAWLVSPLTRRGHTSGDVSAFAAGLRWGESLGLEYVVKISRRFVAVQDWLPEFSRLAADRVPTIGAPDAAFGWPLRTEFVGLRVDDWITLLPQLQAYEVGHVEVFVGGLAQSVGPTALLEFLGPSRIIDHGNYLWYSFADSHRYAALSAEWGLAYTSNDFNTQANLFSS